MSSPTEVSPHRSVSQLTTYIRCGESYRLEKVARAPSLPAAWFIQGTAFHQAAEDWERSGRTLGPQMVAELYDQEWDKEYARYLEVEPNIELWLTGGRVKPADDISRRKDKGRQQILDYLIYAEASEFRPVMIGGEPALEYPFEVHFGSVRVIGKIDQIIEHIPTGRWMVRDLKTGTKLPDYVVQLGVYDLAIEDDLGVRPGWGDYYMAKNNAPTKPYDLSSFTREGMTRLFETMDKGVQQEVFLPNPGDACRTCGVFQYCSAVGSDPTFLPTPTIGVAVE